MIKVYNKQGKKNRNAIQQIYIKILYTSIYKNIYTLVKPATETLDSLPKGVVSVEGLKDKFMVEGL